MAQSKSQKADIPNASEAPVVSGPASTKFANETWHLNGFNMCEVIVIREGADARGHRYLDGRHQVRVALYEDMRAAADAVRQHNSNLAHSVAETA